MNKNHLLMRDRPRDRHLGEMCLITCEYSWGGGGLSQTATRAINNLSTSELKASCTSYTLPPIQAVNTGTPP